MSQTQPLPLGSTLTLLCVHVSQRTGLPEVSLCPASFSFPKQYLFLYPPSAPERGRGGGRKLNALNIDLHSSPSGLPTSQRVPFQVPMMHMAIRRHHLPPIFKPNVMAKTLLEFKVVYFYLPDPYPMFGIRTIAGRQLLSCPSLTLGEG